MKHFPTQIRNIHPGEYDLLREFLYQAIYLPEGVALPPRSVVDLPELQVYVAGFGTRPGDHCLVAETEEKVWVRRGAASWRTTVISTAVHRLWPSRYCRSIVDWESGRGY